MERKARVQYMTVLSLEGYGIEIYKNGKWVLFAFYPDVNGYIHTGIIITFLVLKDDGYDVSYDTLLKTKGDDEKWLQ